MARKSFPDKHKPVAPIAPATPVAAPPAPPPPASIMAYTTDDLLVADFLRRHGVNCPHATSGTPMIFQYALPDTARIHALLQQRKDGLLT